MTREEHVRICSVCKNRRSDINKGLICALTEDIADFEGECPNYDEDPEAIYYRQLEEQPEEPLVIKPASIGLAVLTAAIACIVCAALWALFTVLTGYQYGIIAIVLGAIIGFAVRFFAKGTAEIFGIIAAIFTIIACLLGDFLGNLGFLAKEEGITIFQALAALDWSYFFKIMFLGFDFMSIVFYLIAVVEAYKFAIVKKSDD